MMKDERVAMNDEGGRRKDEGLEGCFVRGQVKID